MAEELPPPFVSVPGLSNFRDIGGWPVVASDGSTVGKVRSRVFYRGPDVAPITEEGTAKLKELGIVRIFDLRSKPQIDKAGGPKEVEGIPRVWLPVFSEEQYSQDKAALRYQQYSSEGTEVCGRSRCMK